MFGVEGIWLVVFALGLLALVAFIWYNSRGTEWMMTDEELADLHGEESLKQEIFDMDEHSVVH